MSTQRILIIGGGIGGLCLAQGLKRHGVPFTVFERDSASSYRSQGYRFRINEALQSLRSLLNPELWDLFERTCPDMSFVHTKGDALTGTMARNQPGILPGGLRALASFVGLKMYNVDRGIFRSLLLLGLEQDVKYGKAFERYEITPTGVTAFFSDGTSEEGSLLVGAEGVRSPVRKQLLPMHHLFDSGVRSIYGRTPLTEEFACKFPGDGLHGITVISDATPILLFSEPMRFSRDASSESQGQLQSVKDYVYWVLLFNSTNIGMSDSELLALSPERVAQLSLELTKAWDPKVRAMLEFQDAANSAALRIGSVKPNIPTWTPNARVTIMGDAAHATLPTGGAGANIAIKDAAGLLKAIVEKGVSVESIGKYESEMRAYAKPAIERSLVAAARLYGQRPLDECEVMDV